MAPQSTGIILRSKNAERRQRVSKYLLIWSNCIENASKELISEHTYPAIQPAKAPVTMELFEQKHIEDRDKHGHSDEGTHTCIQFQV